MPTPINTNCPTGTRDDLQAVKLPAKNIENLIVPTILPMRALPQAGGVLDIAVVSSVVQAGSPSGDVETADSITELVDQDTASYTTATKTVAKAIPFASVSDIPGFTLADKEAKLAVNLKESQGKLLESLGATAVHALATPTTVTIADTGSEFIAAVQDGGKHCRKYAGKPVFVTNKTNFANIISAIPAISDALTTLGISVTATLTEMRANNWGGIANLAVAKVASIFGMPVVLGEDTLSCVDEAGAPVSLAGWAPAGNITVGEGQAAVDYAKAALCFVLPAASMADVLDESNLAIFGFTGLFNPAPAEVQMPADLGDESAQRAYAAAMLDQYTVIRSQPAILKNGGQNEYTCVSRPAIVIANADAATVIAGADKISLS